MIRSGFCNQGRKHLAGESFSPDEPISDEPDTLRARAMGQNVLAKELVHAFEEAKALERQYLDEHGWKYVCNVPGAFWLWQKALPDGRVVLLEAGMAREMQEEIDIQDKIEKGDGRKSH